MEEQLVSLEVARLLKEKGFCEGSTYFYSNLNSTQELVNNHGSFYINGMELDYIEAPTQSLVQKWLREAHKVMVLVDFDATEDKCFWSNIYVSDLVVKQTKNHAKYEDALEEGLLEVLKLI